VTGSKIANPTPGAHKYGRILARPGKNEAFGYALANLLAGQLTNGSPAPILSREENTMTAHLTRPFASEFLASIANLMRRAGVFLGRALIGVAVILAAGLIAVMTAIAGLVIAGLALVFRFAGRAELARMASRNGADASSGEVDEIILDAKPTSRGWRVQ